MSVGVDGFRSGDISSENKYKIECLPGEHNDFCKTFVINEEDHTLGNALKHIIANNSDVIFCGYTIPHPMERKIHFRIQSVNKPATDVLRQGLTDLKQQNDNVLKLIKKAAKKYEGT